MKKVLCTLAVLCAFVCSQSRAQVTVTFKVDIKDFLQSGGSVYNVPYLAGNFALRGCSELPDWQPVAGEMILWKDSTYIRTLEFDGTAFDSLMWKYVRANSWGPGDEGSSWLPPDPACVKVTDNNNRKVWLPSIGNIVISSKWAACHQVTNTTARPLANLSALNSTTICGNDSVRLKANGGTGYSYIWRLDGVRIGFTTDSIFTAKLPGSYTVVVVNSDGASTVSNPAGVTVTVNPAPISTLTALGSTTFCADDSVMLRTSTGAGYAFQWNNLGVAIPGATDSSFVVHQSGNYTVTNSLNGCSDTSSVQVVTVNPLPDASVLIAGSTSFCMGDSVRMSAGSGTETIQWHQNSIPLLGDTLASFKATTSGAYSVLVSANGCSKLSDPINVVAHPLPQPMIDSANVLSTGTFASYQWLLNGLEISGAAFSAFAPAETGLYSVVVTDGNGCSDTSAAIQFTFVGVEGRLTKSVLIYPNPSENQFFVRVKEVSEALSAIRIFDMQGRLIESGKLAEAFSVEVGGELKPGMYWLEMRLNSGVVERIRLVKR